MSQLIKSIVLDLLKLYAEQMFEKKTSAKAQQIQDIESFNFIKRFIPINELQILVKLQLSFVW